MLQGVRTMDEQVEVYMQKYPKSVVDLFLSLRKQYMTA